MSRGPRAPKTRTGPAANGETPTIVAVLLACAAVVAAIIGARAALIGDDGSDTWHTSVREDVKAGAGLVEDVRFVYTEEAQLAFQVAEGEVRAEEARREAQGESGLVKELLEAHAGAQQGVVDTVKSSSSLAKNPKYALPEGGYDVPQRLVDTRGKNPDLVEIDADATEK